MEVPPDVRGLDGLGETIAAGYVQTAGAVLLARGVLLLSCRSIVGEHSSGSVKILFGLPLTRTDVPLWKIIGRTGGIAVPVTAALALLGMIGLGDCLSVSFTAVSSTVNCLGTEPRGTHLAYL